MILVVEDTHSVEICKVPWDQLLMWGSDSSADLTTMQASVVTDFGLNVPEQMCRLCSHHQHKNAVDVLESGSAADTV